MDLNLSEEIAEKLERVPVSVTVGKEVSTDYFTGAETSCKKVEESLALVMERIGEVENLRAAFEEVAKNKGAPGPDRQSIAEVREDLSDLLPALSRALIEGRYVPGAVRRVWIPKSGGKRGLGIPNVVDRVVQQATLRILQPHYEPQFDDSSHGFRPGRSCHTAIREARSYLEEGYSVVVDLDLEKFFDQVNHQRLLAVLERQIRDKRIIVLIRRMLKAKTVMPDGVVVSSEMGTPQGGPLSPLLSNIVLAELDTELRRRGHKFVRYADDCNIYVRSEKAGQRVLLSVSRFISKRMRLKVNEAKSAVGDPGERHFLGFSLPRNHRKGSVDIELSKRSLARVRTRIKELTPRNWGQSIESCIKRVNQYLRGWYGFFHICTGKNVWKTFDGYLRRRLRAIQLKQWRRRRTMAKRLIKLGTRPTTAWGTIYNKLRAIWQLSNTPAVKQALNIAYFTKLGLFSLWQHRQNTRRRTNVQMKSSFV